MDMSLVLGGVAFVGGIVIWAVRQEGRLNGHDKQHDDHRARDEERREEIAEFRREVREDVGYIRQRIDRAVNGRHE